jgi:hypothetical protein
MDIRVAGVYGFHHAGDDASVLIQSQASVRE